MKSILFRSTGLGLGLAIGVTTILASSTLLGQGTVNFGNDSSSLVTNTTTSLPVPGDRGVLAALYSAPVGVTNFVQLGAVVPVGVPVPGAFAGGTRTTTNLPGQTVQFQVRSWSGVYSNYEQAVAAASPTGVSPVLSIAVGGATNPPMVPASLTAGGLRGFSMQAPAGPVPGAPTVSNVIATSITSTSAVLNASVSPNSLATFAWFEWGSTTNYGTTTVTQSLGVVVSTAQAQLTGLQPGTVYHFRARATNSTAPTISADRSFSWNSNRPPLSSSYNPLSNLFTLNFTGNVGQAYMVQTSTNLSNWTTLGPAQDLQTGSFRFVETNTVAAKFYRLFLP